MKAFKICLPIFLIGVLGAVLCLTETGLYLEEEIGLSWLFKLRGPIKPPEKVVIVSIDKFSAEVLHLPEDPEKWPRSYYAQLIKRLNRQEPAIIAFNIHFGETRNPENDAVLASAMAENRNVILSNYLKQYAIPSLDGRQQYTYERIIQPVSVLDNAALGTAPFPLPKSPSTVKQFWSYKNSAGDIPTFPATVFQCYLFKQAYPELHDLLGRIDPVLSAQLPVKFDTPRMLEILQKIKIRLANGHETLDQLNQLILKNDYPSEIKRLLKSWLALLKERDSLYLNYYGAKTSITTIPFYQAMVMEILNPDIFRNKIVMVGYSENIEPEKNQGLYSVFSKSSGDNISPIEIAATAVSNLIDDAWIKPLKLRWQFFLILTWGVMMSALCRLFSYRISVILIILTSLGYLGVACYEFSTKYIWLPTFIPVMVQTPLVLLMASLLRFLRSKEEKRNIQKAFSFYLPDAVVNEVTTQTYDGTMQRYGELMHGVCMATDAGQYTTLSETMNPLEVNELMNDYYSVMFPQVTRHDGIISDVIGDAMLAVWAKPTPDIQCRKNACEAALAIKAQVDRFNQSQPHQLPTRLGLHCGEMRLGNVGAMEHYEYRAIGDTVNTATRIENLNKLLGTQILVSASVIENLSGYAIRETGIFILKGKTIPITLFELLESTGTGSFQLMSEFTQAVKLFQNQQWAEALDAFLDIGKNHPNDGPTRFYINYLQQQLPYLQKSYNTGQAFAIEIR